MSLKKILVIIASVTVSVLVCTRIIYINKTAVVTPTKIFSQDQSVPLDGDFQESREEKTNGYSIKVLEAEFISYHDLVTRYGESEEYLPLLWRPKELVLVTMEIKNENNDDGYLFLFDFFLQAENYVLKPELDLWKMVQPNGGGSMSVKLKPNSSYTLVVPYAPNPSDEDYGTFVSQKTDYNLVVSRYPTKKMIKVEVA